MIRSGNPALSTSVFSNVGRAVGQATMTIQGTVNKTGILLGLVFFSAMWTWNLFFQGSGAAVKGLMVLGGIGGFIMALITIFKKEKAGITAPLYAVFEGLFLGGISATFEAMYPGVVMQAVGLTFATLFSLLGAYKSGMIKPTENFKLGLAAATGGIMLVYFIGFIMSFFTSSTLGIFGNSIIGIGFSLVVVVIAALNLVMDFDFIESGAEQGAPKYMEWYGAFGLMVTLIWLYLEILRLLVKLQSRD